MLGDMRLRSGTFDPAAPGPQGTPQPDAQTGALSGQGATSPFGPDGVARWRIPPRRSVAKGALAVLFLLAALADHDRTWQAFTGLGALIMAGHAARDILLPVRLAADSQGATIVSGLARRLRVPWSQVETITATSHRHLGLNTRVLELDLGSDLHLLTEGDLGAPPEDVARVLRDLADAALEDAAPEPTP